jgi:hypothetical protein
MRNSTDGQSAEAAGRRSRNRYGVSIILTLGIVLVLAGVALATGRLGGVERMGDDRVVLPRVAAAAAEAPDVGVSLTQRDCVRRAPGPSMPLGSDVWSPLLDGAIGARRSVARELGLEELVRRVLRIRESEDVALA